MKRILVCLLAAITCGQVLAKETCVISTAVKADGTYVKIRNCCDDSTPAICRPEIMESTIK